MASRRDVGTRRGLLGSAISIFETVIALPSDQRERGISKACGDDDELRTYVQQLLAIDDSGMDSFLRSPHDTETTLHRGDHADSPDLVGHELHRYRILEKVGQGGTGSVWLAEDSFLHRKVAIKVLLPTLAESSEARQRFLREARAASMLSHPGIARVYDAGEEDEGFFIAFEFIDGETMTERVNRGPLPWKQAAAHARQTAEALSHSHARGILHRDVTSRNIILRREGSAVLVDFGLALPPKHTRLTAAGAIMGTLAYLAPEVIRGQRDDSRSDLYGLGVVLYEMLTGSLPFEGTQAQELLHAAIHEDPEPPTRRAVGLPADLDLIVLKALAKNPDHRYQRAKELIDELRSLEERDGG